MPNIAITTYCNLHCPYCFANTMIQEEQVKNISVSQLLHILNWLEPTIKKTKDRIGIIGGEPTLHPQFKEILSIVNKFCNTYNLPSILFTNGIYLKKYLSYIDRNMHILININSPHSMNNESWSMLNNTLSQIQKLGWFELDANTLLNDKINLGCNICEQIDDYSFIWELADKYNIKVIRMSITAPINFISKNEYYFKMKNKFLDFVQQAHQHSVLLDDDCNQIPFCYFSKVEQELITKQLFYHRSYHFKDGQICTPTVDITPDFYASACFGAYDLINCNYFDNYDELYRYLLNKQVIPKYILNNDGICNNCQEHELFKCQGGCLSFINNKK